jgi:elongation factor 2
MVPFESITYVSEPVVTIAIEPKNPQDIRKLLEALEKLATEDPNLRVTTDKQSGEYLLSGMGELHLEIATNRLKQEFSLEVKASNPRVAYMEGVTKRGLIATAKSPNRQNWFSIQVGPEQEELLTDNEKETEESYNILSFDEHRNVLIDCSNKTQPYPEDVLEAIISGFEYTCKAGPLCGEPARHVKVNITDLQVNPDENPNEIMRGIGKAIFGSFLTAKPVLLEPIYATTISVASELSGECTRIFTTRRGKVKGFEQKGLLTSINGFIPVAETFNFSKELRSATSGRAIWQSIFDHWEKMPDKLADETIVVLRKRKGLSLDVPKPEKFLE